MFATHLGNGLSRSARPLVSPADPESGALGHRVWHRLVWLTPQTLSA